MAAPPAIFRAIRLQAGRLGRVAASGVLLALAACARMPQGAQLSSAGVEISQADAQAIESQLALYRVAPGDLITVDYYRNFRKRTTPFRLDVGDRIFVRVRGSEEYSREVVVLPDGTASIPKVGIIQAQGLTLTELDVVLTEAYGQELVNPDVDVLPVETQRKVNDFLDLVFRNSNDRDRSLVVRADGRVNLPLLGAVDVGGLTLTEIQEQVTEGYNGIFDNAIDVAVNVSRAARANVAILGEVHQPGVYPLQRHISPLFALALAGGEQDTADLTRVVILRPDDAGGVRTFFADVHGQIWRLEGDAGVFVQAGDVVYVPRSDIANLDLFVDQYIRKLIPFDVGVSAFFAVQ